MKMTITTKEKVVLGTAAGAVVAGLLTYGMMRSERKLPRKDNRADEAPVASELRVPYNKGGFFFGEVPPFRDHKGQYHKSATFYGKPMGVDGNILVIGGPGSGKTTGHVYPTMKTWKGSMVMLDVKGDMEAIWRSIHKKDGKKLYVFAPFRKGAGTCTFDPFSLMEKDPTNAAGHACDIAEALVPIPASDRDPVWREAAQNVLAGALLHYFHRGRSFIEAVKAMGAQPVLGIIAIIMGGRCMQAKSFVSKFQGASAKTTASIGMNLTKLSRFLLNPEVIGSLTPDSARPMLDWAELNSAQEPFDVIIDVHGVALSQCAPLVRLMLTQLVKVLSMREEKSYKKSPAPPVLICIDEFPQLERMPAMISALTTLRSKDVTIALCVQSPAALDATYGHDEARVIRDACSFQVFRSVNDWESQKNLSESIGTMDVLEPSLSVAPSMRGTGTSISVGRRQRPVVYPEALGRLRDPILVTPYGTFHVPRGVVYPPEKKEPVMTVEMLSAEVESLQAMLEVSLDMINQVGNQLDVGDDNQEQAALPIEGECGLCSEAGNSNQGRLKDEVCKYCAEAPRKLKDIMEHLGVKSRPHFAIAIVKPLLDQGRLEMTHPESPKHPDQKYRAVCTNQQCCSEVERTKALLS